MGYSCIADAVEDEMRQSSRGVVVAPPLQVRTRGAKEEAKIAPPLQGKMGGTGEKERAKGT